MGGRSSGCTPIFPTFCEHHEQSARTIHLRAHHTKIHVKFPEERRAHPRRDNRIRVCFLVATFQRGGIQHHVEGVY